MAQIALEIHEDVSTMPPSTFFESDVYYKQQKNVWVYRNSIIVISSNPLGVIYQGHGSLLS